MVFGLRRIRPIKPSLIKPFLAASVIIALILSSLFVIAIITPTPKVIDLDIRFSYLSNSTSDVYSSLHHWAGSETYSDVYGVHVNWLSSYSEVSTNSSGSFADFMYERTQDTYIQWNEIEVFSNNTWTFLLNIILPSVADVSILIKGDNASIIDVLASITDGRPNSIFQDGLNAFGIEGLDISADILIVIDNDELRKWFDGRGLSINVSSDLNRTFQDIPFGTIPDDPYS
ncbi:MAG: hypothetical protein ACW98Y_09840 [Candidatus Thorarchaeota archaeon]|jgi:hypothetical protein